MVISHRIGASFRIHLLILILQYSSVIILLVISYFPASALSASGSMGIISAREPLGHPRLASCKRLQIYYFFVETTAYTLIFFIAPLIFRASCPLGAAVP